MTVTNETSSVTHVGNGATTLWPYTFVILRAADAEVRLYDLLTDVSTVLTPSEYTITGIGDQNGGDVVYAPGGVPIPATKRITISRLVAFTQETDLTNQTPYYPEVLEKQLDYMVMQTQQLKADMARAVLVQPGSPIDPNDLINVINSAAVTAITKAGEAAGSATAAANQVTYAEEWAQSPQNMPVSPAAGGDGVSTFSALHWALDARESADSINLPTLVPGDEGKLLAVKLDLSGYETSEAVTFADQTQAEAGLSTDTVMSPLRTAQAIAAYAGDVVLQAFTASGTFAKEDDDYAYWVECIGGGGSGPKTSSGNLLGGMPGSVTSRFFHADEITNTVSVTVGAGGATVSTANTNGNPGGASTFGSYLTADGGIRSLWTSTNVQIFCYGTIGQQQIDNNQTAGIGFLPKNNMSLMATVQENLSTFQIRHPTHGRSTHSAAGEPPISLGYGRGALTLGAPGSAPGGGGGAGTSTAGVNGGAGGRGEVRVYRFKRIKQ